MFFKKFCEKDENIKNRKMNILRLTSKALKQ